MKTITIIGGGLGGLTAGALLSKKGYKVTLLEQHNIVGGSATTFRRKGGYTCEVGLHELDSAYIGIKKEIFETLGVYDNVEFVQPDEFFRVVSKGIDITMPHDVPRAIEVLSQEFPDEKDAIDKYFSLIKSIGIEYEKLAQASWWQYALFPFVFKNILRYRTASTKDVMNRLFRDEKLKLILNTNVGYYSDTVENLNFLLHAMAQYHFFSGGGWYIKGGSQKLSNHIASVILDNGGQIITRANITKISKHEVTYEHKKQVHKISSDIIISNLSPATTYSLANIAYDEKLQPAESLLTMYLGFKHNLKSVYGKKPYASFFLGSVKSISDYDNAINGSIEHRGFGFTDYSQIDSGLTDDPAKSFAVMLTTDFLSDWESLTDEEYKEKKQAVLENFLDKLESYYPNIKDHIEFAEVATAKTMQRYLKTPNGTAYGYAPTPKQFFRTPQIKSKKMPNLYFVGAWVMSGGFTPAIMSGAMCAEEIGR